MKNIFITPIILIFLSPLVHAQAAIVATGGDVTGEGSLSYSVGQIDQLTIYGDNYQLSQGVLQIFDPTTDVDESVIHDWGISISPNPTIHEITLKFRHQFEKKNSPRIALFDGSGVKIIEKSFKPPYSTISLANLPAATYFLSIIDDARAQVITYKIIKM